MTAAEYFREAAEQGYDEAQKDLGYCYMYGIGVAKNLSTAREWLKKAAEQGNIDAHCLLAQTIYAQNVRDTLRIEPDYVMVILGIDSADLAVREEVDFDETKKAKAFMQTKDGIEMIHHYEMAAEAGNETAQKALKFLKGFAK